MDLSIGEQYKKRKAKEERRRKAKDERKNKLKEQAHQRALEPAQKHLKQVQTRKVELNKEQLTVELMREMSLP
jgi:hypothetical protein